MCVPGLIESSVGIGEQRQVEEACADLLRIFLTRRYDGVAVCGNYELDVDYYFKYNGNAGSHVEHVISSTPLSNTPSGITTLAVAST